MLRMEHFSQKPSMLNSSSYIGRKTMFYMTNFYKGKEKYKESKENWLTKFCVKDPWNEKPMRENYDSSKEMCKIPSSGSGPWLDSKNKKISGWEPENCYKIEVDDDYNGKYTLIPKCEKNDAEQAATTRPPTTTTTPALTTRPPTTTPALTTRPPTTTTPAQTTRPPTTTTTTPALTTRPPTTTTPALTTRPPTTAQPKNISCSSEVYITQRYTEYHNDRPTGRWINKDVKLCDLRITNTKDSILDYQYIVEDGELSVKNANITDDDGIVILQLSDNSYAALLGESGMERFLVRKNINPSNKVEMIQLLEQTRQQFRFKIEGNKIPTPKSSYIPPEIEKDHREHIYANINMKYLVSFKRELIHGRETLEENRQFNASNPYLCEHIRGMQNEVGLLLDLIPFIPKIIVSKDQQHAYNKSPYINDTTKHGHKTSSSTEYDINDPQIELKFEKDLNDKTNDFTRIHIKSSDRKGEFKFYTYKPQYQGLAWSIMKDPITYKVFPAIWMLCRLDPADKYQMELPLYVNKDGNIYVKLKTKEYYNPNSKYHLKEYWPIMLVNRGFNNQTYLNVHYYPFIAIESAELKRIGCNDLACN